ncbi:HAMP domain-containing histidine kinase [Salicibibacter cibi]|uniref:histidine kinase n=1 Tax=Salicibibacter cibi TaxID=2743001 RepID=A0A7T7CFB4_9BACI|nr:HAMP domain-containing sensor histidine kinase [Salicibibacter cibi]QQK79923.1 HAMP domain-containing histidine kinase [Salicibibacter cibi]
MEGVLHILRRYVVTTILISIFLLLINFFLLGTLVFTEINQEPSPENVVEEVADDLNIQGGSYDLNEHSEALLQDNQAWAMLLGNDGDVQWNYRLPDDLPRSYDLVDVAQFSRYYLNDYPVYIWEHENGLVVMGYPQDSYWKYQIQFLSDWIESFPLRLVLLFLFNIALAMLISIIMGSRLIKKIRPLVTAVHNLGKEKDVQLDHSGLFGDLAQSINAASSTLENKTMALKERDEARSNWIAGISHDIRTPLSMVLGYASDMEDNTNLTHEQRNQATVIRRQGEKLGSLINDLNLVSMLEYEMQPINLKKVRLSVLVRQVVTDFLNDGLDDKFNIELNMLVESIQIIGDEKLLSRAVGNLVQNSIRHNPQGCDIMLETHLSEDRSKYYLIVEDNGKGIPKRDIADVTELPYTSKKPRPDKHGHGLGIPMVARIVEAHGGNLTLESDAPHKGLIVSMEFPVSE